MSLQYPKIESSQLRDLPLSAKISLVAPVAMALQRILDWSGKVLRLGDNIAVVTIGTATLPVVSGTEYTFKPPFKPLAFTPSHAITSAGAAVSITGWKPNLGRGDGFVGLTATLSASGIVTGILWGAK